MHEKKATTRTTPSTAHPPSPCFDLFESTLSLQTIESPLYKLRAARRRPARPASGVAICTWDAALEVLAAALADEVDEPDSDAEESVAATRC